MFLKINFYHLLISLLFTSEIFGQQTLLGFQSSWSYFDEGNLNNSGWFLNSYNSDSWKLGNAQLGYGDGDEATVIGFGPSSSSKYPTAYFRKVINFSGNTDLSFKLKVDDGAVIYLNNTEVHRVNMPSGVISFNTLATSAIEDQFFTFTVPSAAYNVGLNVIAVEVHQASLNSSDLSFDLEVKSIPAPPFPGIYINEIMASNKNTIDDNKGASSDWIEIFNNTNGTFDFANKYISDDIENIQKFRFPNTIGSFVVLPGQRKLIWASGDVSRGQGHLPWSLSADGEYVILTDSDGVTIIDSVKFGKQIPDVSYGRLESPIDSLVYFSPATPNATNGYANAYLGFMEPPSVSHQSGYYTNGFNLSVSSAEGSNVIYTDDGSSPRSENLISKNFIYLNQYPEYPGQSMGSFTTLNFLTKNYTGSIGVSSPVSVSNKYSRISTTHDHYPIYTANSSNNIEKCRIYKFKSQKLGYIDSETVSRTFFFNARTHNLPVFSIQVTPEKLWDYYIGLGVAGVGFVNHRQNNPSAHPSILFNNYYMRDGIPEASFSLFKNMDLKAEHNGTLNVHGGQSRNTKNKSLRLKLDESHGINMFGTSEQFSGFVLRNSGNDANLTLLRDGSVHVVCANLNFEKQRYQPAITFLNGEYNGILNFRDRLDNDYLSIKYDIAKVYLETGDNQTVDNSSGDYEQLTTFVQTNNFSNNTNYEYLKSKMDMTSFIDYTIVQSFYGNIDALSNNYGYWRFKGSKECENCVKDNKWRFLLYDVDYAYTDNQSPFAIFHHEAGNNYYYKYIKNNPIFRIDFVNRYADLLNSNFKPSYVKNVIDSLKNILNPELNFHFQRWNPFGPGYSNQDITNFKAFADFRPNEVFNSIRSEFDISGTFVLTVSSANQQAGFVKVNTLNITSSTPGVTESVYPWSGTYFDDIPITIAAIPNIGYKFSHWIHNNQIIHESIITVTTATNKEYIAHFEELILSQNPTPTEFGLLNCSYKLKSWSSQTLTNVHPSSMKFVYFEDIDPLVTSKVAGFTSGGYNSNSRTRINGMNESGFSFINTTGSNINEGYPIGKLGGALLALNTLGLDSARLRFKARTFLPGSRKYGIRLQFREGDLRGFSDFTPLIDYQGSVLQGDSIEFVNVPIPLELLQKPYVQILWRYYYTGIGTSGSRDQLGIDDIQLQTFVSRTGSKSNLTELVENPSYVTSSEKILINSDLKYKVENGVTLLPGFLVEMGNTFEAKVEGCEN